MDAREYTYNVKCATCGDLITIKSPIKLDLNDGDWSDEFCEDCEEAESK